MDELPRPDVWFATAKDIFREILSSLARYGVHVDPQLRFIPTDAPTPSYEPATRTIAFGAPDPAAPAGRLYIYMVQHLVGAADLAETRRAMEVPMPWTIAHEVVHHLRHHYGAPIGNDFVEEQVVNCVAIALIGEHPRYRDKLPALKRWADRISERARSLSPETTPYLGSFRLEAGDVLVSMGGLAPSSLRDARRLAAITGTTAEEILLRTGRVTADQVARANDERERTEAYFNRRYMVGFREYWLFGTEWLARYLERDDLPTLGDALARFILTDDWEASQRDATRLLLEHALRGADPMIAAAAAPALAEMAGSGATAPLVAALADPRPVVQAAALQALGRVPGGPEAGAEAATALLGRDDDVSGAAARLLRRAGIPIEATPGASPAQRAEAMLARLPDDPGAYAEIDHLLDDNESSVLAALAALAEAGPGPLAERVETFLEADTAAVRAAAARALAGSTAAVASLAARLEDENRMVRRAARDAIVQLDPSAWPALKHALASVPDALGIEMLSLIDHRAMPDAVERLIDLAGSLRQRAQRLERIEATGAGLAGLDMLNQAAGEERRRLARLSLRAIGRVVDPETLELAERALDSPDPEHRAGGRDLVRTSLGRHGRALARLLEERPPAARSPDAGQALRAYAKAEPGTLRALAAYLGPQLLAPEQARNLLQRLTADPETLVREEANASLRRLASQSEAAMLTTIEKLIFLRSVPTFAECGVDTLRRVARHCVVQHFAGGETILREGEPGLHFYIITEGRIAISVAGRQIDELGPRHYFGEMALFDGGPRSATATALVGATLLRLDRDDFYRLGRDEPDLLVGVIRVLSERLRAHMARLEEQGAMPGADRPTPWSPDRG